MSRPAIRLSTPRARIAIAAIDAGADVIELGVPFSDPLADGPVIQRASERALAAGHPPRRCARTGPRDSRRASRRGPHHLHLFQSYSSLRPRPIRRRCRGAAGADGVLVTDMIVEEADEYLAEMHRTGLAPVFLAAPTSPDERLEAIADTFSRDSFTPSRAPASPASSRALTSDAAALVARIRRWTTLPVAVGFGISNAEHVAQVAEFADAAVIGSAIVELIERLHSRKLRRKRWPDLSRVCASRRLRWPGDKDSF